MVISFCGGLKGTGEPPALKNLQTGQRHRILPISKSSTDRNRLTGARKGIRTGKSSSSHNEAKTKSTLKPNQNMIPSGVSIILNLFLVVATQYINSAYLSATLMALPSKAAWAKYSPAWISRQPKACFLDMLNKITVSSFNSIRLNRT